LESVRITPGVAKNKKNSRVQSVRVR